MLALNRTTIDFFSLDVEGAELQVLKTIDFKKLNIRTLTVELKNMNQGKDMFETFLTRQGLKLYKEVVHRSPYVNDLFLVSSDVTPVAAMKRSNAKSLLSDYQQSRKPL